MSLRKTALCSVNVSWIVRSRHGGGWQARCVRELTELPLRASQSELT